MAGLCWFAVECYGVLTRHLEMISISAAVGTGILHGDNAVLGGAGPAGDLAGALHCWSLLPSASWGASERWPRWFLPLTLWSSM